MQIPRLQARAGQAASAAVFLAVCLAPPGRAQVSTSVSGPLTLNQAVSTALATNPAARAAAQQFSQAQARLGQAQAGRRFQITFNSTASGSNASVLQPPPSRETFGTLQNTLTVPLPLGRRPGLAVSQSQEQLAAAQFQFQSARLVLAGQVVTAYYDLLRKQALYAAARESLAQAQQELSDARKRNRAGDVAQLDVLQAQVPAANAQAALVQAENAVAVAQQTLNDLLGRPLDAPLSLTDITALPPILPLTPEQARAFALQRSPDVQAADANIRADEAALEAARLYREPTYSLQAIDTRSNDQTSFSREDTLQAQVSLPLSDGGLGQAQTREAAAALAQARAQAESARRAALVAVSAAYLNARASRAQVTAAQAARDIAQVTYDKTVLGYRNGLFPFVNVVNAQNALAQARIAYVQALYDAASAASALQAAVNGGAVPGAGSTAMPSLTSGAAQPGNTAPPGTNANGVSPAGAGTPGTTPAGTSTTGPATTGTGTP